MTTDTFLSRTSRFALALAAATLSASAGADVTLHQGDGWKLDGVLVVQGAVFQGEDAYFGEDETFIGDDVSDWVEAAAQFGLKAEVDVWGGKLAGAWTGVQTNTWGDDASGLTLDEDDPHELHTELGYVSWTSGTGFMGIEEEGAFMVQAGRFEYTVDTGFLIRDGGGDGGERGGWWLGARKAFSDSFLARLDTGPLLLEGFYLENQPRGGGRKGKVYGGNAEYEFESIGVTLAGTYMEIEANEETVFDDFDAISVRADWQVFESLLLEGEVVEQGDAADGNGYWARGAYTLEDMSWSPVLSYRYAHLSGDDLDSADDERFRPIAYGFTDYGTWYQGEIAGGYALENSNLDSHQLRLTLTPAEAWTVNAIYYKFILDEEHIFGDPVGDDDFGDEVNVNVDWSVNDHLAFNLTLGALLPGEAAKNWTGGDDTWFYLMLWGSYSF